MQPQVSPRSLFELKCNFFDAKKEFPLIKMCRKSLFRRLVQDIQFYPRIKKSPAVGKHLDISGNND